MSYNRLRTGRVSITNQVHLLTSVTANRLPLFDDFQLARIVVAEMRRLEESGLVQSLAWVIMPDHLHWLIALADGNNLSNVAKMLKGPHC
jgi:putative transposase